MRTSYQIYCDYRKAMIKAQELDAVARTLRNVAESGLREEIASLCTKWQGEAANVARSKSIQLANQLYNRASNINRIAQVVRSIAARNYNAEMRALRLARERGYGG